MDVWQNIKRCAESFKQKEPHLKDFFINMVLKHSNFEESLTYVLIKAIHPESELVTTIQEKMLTVFRKKNICKTIFSDLHAFGIRDPACRNLLSVLLFYKGFQALQIYRVSHQLWMDGEMMLALYLHSLACKTYSIDIHPGAKIADSIFIDHGNSIVIGETCVIKTGVSILQDVTLGGTGKDRGDRHPKIGKGVLIGAGSKILGNIKIGDFSKIGASSVVLKNIPAYSVAVGVPAVIVGKNKSKNTAKEMDHRIIDSC